MLITKNPEDIFGVFLYVINATAIYKCRLEQLSYFAA